MGKQQEEKHTIPRVLFFVLIEIISLFIFHFKIPILNIYNIYKLNSKKSIFLKKFPPKNAILLFNIALYIRQVAVFAFQASSFQGWFEKLSAMPLGTYPSSTLLLGEGEHLPFYFVLFPLPCFFGAFRSSWTLLEETNQYHGRFLYCFLYI